MQRLLIRRASTLHKHYWRLYGTNASTPTKYTSHMVQKIQGISFAVATTHKYDELATAWLTFGLNQATGWVAATLASA